MRNELFMKCILLFVVLTVIFSCSSSKEATELSPSEQPEEPERKTYLALGDSYTIGESVSETMRWPVQLAEQFNSTSDKLLEQPTIVAQTGWTTNELQTAINNTNFAFPYDLVTLLIGVNNQYRGYDFERFETEFEELLEFAIEKAGSSNRVIVVSIPDWGVMPFAEGRNREQIAEEIDQYNERKKEITNELNAHFIDITAISREAEEQPSYIANDGLHPSGEQYSAWVNEILPVVNTIFNE